MDFAVEVDSAVASNFMKQKLFGGVEHPQLTKKDLKRSGERERERERENGTESDKEPDYFVTQ